MLFTDSGTCRVKAHCRTCRDREGGRAWRESLGKVFSLPVAAPDFECPHGEAWDAGVGNPPQTNDVEAVGAVCAACEHFRGVQENELFVSCADRGCCGSPTGEVSLRYGSCARWP